MFHKEAPLTLPYTTSKGIEGAAEQVPRPRKPRVRKPPVKQGFDFKPRKQRTPTTRLSDPAKLGAASKPAGGAPRLVELVLRTSHNINGQGYGPGRVTVHEDIAAMLREQEQRVVEAEERFHGRRAYLVGRGLRTREVPYDTFEDSAQNAPPIGTAHKGGWETA